MKLWKSLLRTGLVALVLASITGLPRAEASSMLDFGVMAPTPGSISYAGGNAPLIGTGIQVDNVVGLNTSLNDGLALTCSGCFLNFTTGAFSGATATAWNFGSGGEITITGTLFNGAQQIATGTLLTGNFDMASVTVFNNDFKIAGASFYDLKNDDLASFYGFPTTLPSGDPLPWAGNFNISFNATGDPGDPFKSSTVFSGDVVNQPVPEPGTVLLMGTGLLGLGAWRMRKSKTA